MRVLVSLLSISLFMAVICPSALGVTPTPQQLTASIQTDPSGIFVQWSEVEGATGYSVRVYRYLDSEQAEAALNTSNTSNLFQLPCGFSYYYSVTALGPEGESAPSARVFGQSPDCPYAVPNCDFPMVAVTGSGTYTASTEFHFNDYRIGDKVGPCGDGQDPGTAGTGRDLFYRYTSLADCTLTVSLEPDSLEYNPILYMSNTCEAQLCEVYSNTFLAQPEVITFPVTAGQDYFIFVDGYTTDDSGSFEISFITDDCTGEPSCLPVQEEFSEGGLPQGWTTVNRDSLPGEGTRLAPKAWGIIEDLTGPLYNRVAAAYADPASGGNTEDWLITGPINVGEDAVLRWKDARLGGTGSIFLFNVYAAASPDLSALVSGGPLLSLNRDALGSTFTQREISLAANGIAEQEVYIGFYHFARGTGHLLLDDVSVCEDAPVLHSSDRNGDDRIGLDELLRAIQLFNAEGFHCVQPPATTEDGYVPGNNTALRGCAAHTADYNPRDWSLNLSELLRVIQFFNNQGHFPCEASEDGFCPGAP